MSVIIKSDEQRNNKTCATCKNSRLICMKDGTPDIEYLQTIICCKSGRREHKNSVCIIDCWEEDK